LALAGSDQPPAQAASFATRNLTAAPKVTDRAELSEVIAATYRQVRWPSTTAGKYDGGHLPVWDEHTDTYLNPDAGNSASRDLSASPAGVAPAAPNPAGRLRSTTARRR